MVKRERRQRLSLRGSEVNGNCNTSMPPVVSLQYQIMVQPSWSARCCGTSEEPTVELSVIHEKVLDPKPDESDDDSAAAKSSSSLPKWCCCRKRASAKKLGKKVNAGEIEAKAFPPGKIIHIKLEKSTKPWFLASCYPGQIRVSWVSPEDLCVIVLDRGIVQDHLPTSVLGAMKRCNDHFIQGHFDPLETKHRREELLRNFSSERAENGVFPAELPAGREEEPLAPLPLELEVLGNGQPARSQVDVEVSIEMEDSHV